MFFAPWHQEGWVLGVPSCIIVSNVTPKGDRLMRKVLQGDNLAPFSSDKIQAKILSAAITRTIVLPAEARGSHDGFHSGVG